MLTELRCIIGQNLEILTSTGGEWSCGQAQNCVNFDFQVKFDLEGQVQSTPKTIGILTKLFCMSGSNLVILAGTSDKLSRGQARDWRPHGQTQATTIPEGQNWPRVKTMLFQKINNLIIHKRFYHLCNMNDRYWTIIIFVINVAIILTDRRQSGVLPVLLKDTRLKRFIYHICQWYRNIWDRFFQ